MDYGDTMHQEYRSKDIQRIAQVSKDKLVHWTRIGIIKPVKDAEGRGSSRLYSYRNLIEAMICKELNLFNLDTHMMNVIVNTYLDAPLWEGNSFWEMIENRKWREQIIKEEGVLILQDSPVENGPRYAFALRLKEQIDELFSKHKSFLIINLGKILAAAEG